MPRRVLICIEDAGVAHVVAARLMKDGADGVVVNKPADLVTECGGGVNALVVQDHYGTGEAGASMLRQVRAARGGAVPGVYLLSDELGAADRLVLERQYQVKEFLPVSASPHSIASALIGAAGPDDAIDLELDPDVVLHEDEEKNEFDIEIASTATKMNDLLSGIGFDDEVEGRTVEVSLKELQKLKNDSDVETELPTRRVHDEVTRGNRLMQAAVTKVGEAIESIDGVRPLLTEEGVEVVGMTVDTGDLDARETGLMEFTMPAPGASLDLQLPIEGASREGHNETSIDPLAVLTEAEDLDVPATPAPQLGVSPTTSPGPEIVLETEVVDESAASADAVGEDEMEQIAELKKALVGKKRQLDAATKRIEELEQKLASKGGAAPTIASDGMPTEGVFEEVRYPALLARARGEVFTGSIKMQLPGDTTRTIYVRNGLPVGFTTSEPGEKIGKVLVSQGRISDDQYVKAATRMVERGIKLSEALVDLGLIDAETLDVEIRNLTRDQIIAGFELTQGRFTVNANDAPADRVPTFDFGPGEIYVQGYRQYAPRAEMHALYEQLRPKYLIANSRLPQLRPKLGLGGDDERLLRLLGEAYTVEEAVDRAKLDPDQAARLIASLQALDLVEEWNPGVEQFRARLSSERQHFAEEIARLREENSRREKQLFEGFERALAKITSAVEGGGAKPSVKLSEHVDTPTEVVQKPVSSTTVAPRTPTRTESARVEVAPSPPPPPADEPILLEPVASPPRPPTPGNGTPAIALAPGGIALVDASVLAREPANPAESKFREAVRQAAESRLDEAELTLREAVRMDASRPDFLTALAKVLLANPRYERAGTLPVVKSLLDRAVQLSPDNSEAKRLHQEIVVELGG